MVFHFLAGLYRSPLLGVREMPAGAIEGVDTPTSSSGSDSSSKAEFSQVKLHAQNQIIGSQVLTEERQQVCVCRLHVCVTTVAISLMREGGREGVDEVGGKERRSWREGKRDGGTEQGREGWGK